MTNSGNFDPAADLEPWLHVDPLSLEQAGMLVCGRRPRYGVGPKPSTYEPIMAAMKQAIKRGELRADTNAHDKSVFYEAGDEEPVTVTQADMREWLGKKGISAFFYLSDSKDWPHVTPATSSVKDADKSLDARERTTLLCIIGALAENATLDLSQHIKAGEAVAVMLDAKGVKLSGRTIGEHLKAVREAMDSRKVK